MSGCDHVCDASVWPLLLAFDVSERWPLLMGESGD
jgi:hypothetical protein